MFEVDSAFIHPHINPASFYAYACIMFEADSAFIQPNINPAAYC
jgi:hypothetical protein